jgi:hypothetical protein
VLATHIGIHRVIGDLRLRQDGLGLYFLDVHKCC